MNGPRPCCIEVPGILRACQFKIPYASPSADVPMPGDTYKPGGHRSGIVGAERYDSGYKAGRVGTTSQKMRRDYHNWYSHRLGRHMELLAYGHSGTPVLVFPTSQGKFYEYENSGMIHAIWQKIEWGHLQVFCVDSVDSESWYNRGVHSHDRVARYMAYESYVLHEVLPLIKGVNGADQICTTGCSLGGYYALNFALKHPDLTFACIAMSGAFDMKPFMGDYYDQDFYFNNPVDYVPNVSDSWFLDRYNKMKIVLAVGDHDICLGENFRMAHILGAKGIPHFLDVWTGGERHDWPLWQRMAAKFF